MPKNKNAQALRKLAGDKPQIARWKDKTKEERKAHADHMNKSNPTWKKHLENMAAIAKKLENGETL